MLKTHAQPLRQKGSYRRRYATPDTVPKNGMSAMMMVKTSPMLAPAHVSGIMVVTGIDLNGDEVEDL